jgi:phage tail sheath protein FI
MPELTYQHGTRVNRVPEGTVSFEIFDQTPLAIIGTAPAGDNVKFPYDQPIGITGDPAQIEALGATGTLKDALNGVITASGGRFLPKTAIVRVEEGANVEATLAKVVGSAGSMTGIHAFKGVASELGFKPKIYMAPGYSGQRPGDAANPVVAALVPFLERQRARMLAGTMSTTKEAALAYRADISSLAVDIIDPRVMISGTTGLPVARPAEPYVAGLGCKIIRDGDPNAKKPAGFWVSWSNSVIGGIVGAERPITFDYTDPDTESHLLNENRINTIVRDGGWRFWGGLSASNDDDWMFSNVVRTRFAIEEMVAQDFASIIDAPMTAPAVVEAIVSLDEKLKDMVTAGAIIGGRSFFLPAENSNGQLRRGQLRIEFEAEETPPIHGLTIGSRRNKKYFDVLVEDIVRDLAAQG